jgi:hypothetical protein
MGRDVLMSKNARIHIAIKGNTGSDARARGSTLIVERTMTRNIALVTKREASQLKDIRLVCYTWKCRYRPTRQEKSLSEYQYTHLWPGIVLGE